MYPILIINSYHFARLRAKKIQIVTILSFFMEKDNIQNPLKVPIFVHKSSCVPWVNFINVLTGSAPNNLFKFKFIYHHAISLEVLELFF